MRIGIDMDDTICRTTEIVHDRLAKYSEELNINPLDIMNDEELKKNFFAIYAEDIYSNAEIKRNVKDVLNRLKHRGNEIYIITSRDDDFASSKTTAYEVTKKWLDNNGIEYDKIITSVYRETRAEIVKENKIDLMIDNDPYNFKMITGLGTNCILFDDREKYMLKENYYNNWLEVEKYIERNH